MNVDKNIHTPVLLNETLQFLKLKKGSHVIDLTVGEGGHSMAFLKLIKPQGFLVGLDWDSGVLQVAQSNLEKVATCFRLYQARYDQIDVVLAELKVTKVDVIFADLGLSSWQLEASGRGFSFQKNEPLDMRFDERTKTRARDLINEAAYEDLCEWLFKYGEEPQARKIARLIIEYRAKKKIESSRELAELISTHLYRKKQKINPATKTFQALRIKLNDELGVLSRMLGKIAGILAPGGKVAIITYHSLEDRLVKNHFKALSLTCSCPKSLPLCVCGNKPLFKVLTAKPIRPTAAEVNQNRRARSAKLRIYQKI